MPLFNTAIHYNVYLDIPDDINFSWNYIYDDTVFNLDNFIQNLNIKNNQSLIVLWGVDRRINVKDRRFNKLNEWYHSVKNPMILFNGAVYQNSPGVLRFPYQQIEFFRYLSKYSIGEFTPAINKSKKLSNLILMKPATKHKGAPIKDKKENGIKKGRYFIKNF